MDTVTITFNVQRFSLEAPLKERLDAFVALNQDRKHELIVEIDPTGLGDVCMDHLSAAGFVVIRAPQQKSYNSSRQVVVCEADERH